MQYFWYIHTINNMIAYETLDFSFVCPEPCGMRHR